MTGRTAIMWMVAGAMLLAAACAGHASGQNDDGPEQPEQKTPDTEVRDQPAPSKPDDADADTPPASGDAASPAKPEPPKHDPKVVEALKKIEARSEETKSLRVPLTWTRENLLTGDLQRRVGTFYYQQGPPARFAAHLEGLILDRRLVKQNRWIIFDGAWIAEKFVDEKRFVRHQVVPRDASPEQRDALMSGQGPFPLPMNFRHKVILDRFEVKLLPTFEGFGEDELPKKTRARLEGAQRLQLTPRKSFRTSLVLLDLWYDEKSLLPRLAVSVDEDETISTIELRYEEDPRRNLNVEIEAGVFDTSPPDPPTGWDVTIKPLPARDQAGEEKEQAGEGDGARGDGE